MSVNFIELQDKIKSEPELIVKILEHLDYRDIKDKGDYFAARNSDGDNSNAFVIYKDTLKYRNYTRGHNGNIISLVMMAVLISVSLGICNLLPIPVLDGGHILFYVIELIRGKPMKPKTEAAINTAFMILLLGFMLFITVKDVVGLF